MSEFIDNSIQVRRQIQQQLAGGLNAGNEFMINTSRSGSPVKSGELRDSHEVIHEASESDLVAGGAAKAPYAATINRGSASKGAQPFWSQAWIRMKTNFGRFFNG